ncbi:MAG TPA: hypothetical protein VKH37_02775 [Ferruginibacter sp.]|nr:hypothetical protein [Ferruginibacter sp.]
MKALFCLPAFALLSCTQHAAKKPPVDDTAKVEIPTKVDNSIYYITKDSLTIIGQPGDTLSYSKDEFNEMIDDHPELVSNNIHNPDQLYHCNGETGEFNSEVGQDNYFMLYAYFLKSKNGDTKYAERRRKLIGIYSNINALFQHFEYGGTYFGHQYARIPGYAEFSIYLFRQNENYPLYKTYDITKQKDLYIKSLRQLITDESSIDFNTNGKDKAERTMGLNKIVDEIDKAITDNYYLRSAQDFQYGHYVYY